MSRSMIADRRPRVNISSHSSGTLPPAQPDDEDLRRYRAALCDAYNASIDVSHRHPAHPATLARLLGEAGLSGNVQHLTGLLGVPESAGREALS